MSIYIHIPFCRSKCYYCGFYSVASTALKEEYISALLKEIRIRKDYLDNKEIKTIYFGGGTPSILKEKDLKSIFKELEKHFIIKHDAEITIELNPEDLTREKLSLLKLLGVNRLSIGVQTFSTPLLKTINRTHSHEDIINGINRAKELGFENIGIDFIIGLPNQTTEDIKRDFIALKDMYLSHLSIYVLTIDPKTVFEYQQQKGLLVLPDDETVTLQYELVCKKACELGFEHYEISNYARNGQYSKHNTAYWQQKPYLGLGAAAHSYNLTHRRWNISNIRKYIDSLNNHTEFFVSEALTHIDKYNEYIMTSLRTKWGLDYEILNKHFPDLWNKTKKSLEKYSNSDLIISTEKGFRITEKGWLVSDSILSDLFIA